MVLTCRVMTGEGREACGRYSESFGVCDTISYKRMLGCSHESVLTKVPDIFYATFQLMREE